MAAIRTSASMILKEMFIVQHHLQQLSSLCTTLPILCNTLRFTNQHRKISFSRIRYSASESGADHKVSARLSQVQHLLHEAEERAASAGNDPPPKITLDHVTVSFARSGGPGGQNVNKVNTKVDMRFNVNNAYWLSERVREKIMQMEKNRINKDGEIVISSTKTRTQKGNIDDALGKLQAIIDAASYVPPPPSEEQKKKIAKMFCCHIVKGLLLGSRDALKARRLFLIRRHLEETETVGTNITML
ncbi:RF-1 domain-containing protein [Cephalotus follicularis]|uniref:RF-1 domain-containing protein n=1 Tax=Cephalotus follicularis TaxID=3775 RepID=A0A1Q3CXJ0_CEPFO|nr:RF-1 domain-containing protein [Cephalotus follicularis]